MNRSTRSDDRNEIQAYAILLKLNCDGCAQASGSALNDRIGILSAGKKASLLAVLRQHIGLSEHLHQAFGFECLDGCAQVQTREEGEEIQFIRQRSCNGATRHAQCRRRELSGGHAGNRVTEAGTEDVDAKLIAPAAIYAGKYHLEQNLWLRGRHLNIQEVDDFAANGSDLDGSIGAVQILDGATEKDRSVVRADLENLTRKLI